MDMSDKKICWRCRCPDTPGGIEQDGDSALLAGYAETFGINVFKVREVGRTPHITHTEHAQRALKAHFFARQRDSRFAVVVSRPRGQHATWSGQDDDGRRIFRSGRSASLVHLKSTASSAWTGSG